MGALDIMSLGWVFLIFNCLGFVCFGFQILQEAGHKETTTLLKDYGYGSIHIKRSSNDMRRMSQIETLTSKEISNRNVDDKISIDTRKERKLTERNGGNTRRSNEIAFGSKRETYTHIRRNTVSKIT